MQKDDHFGDKVRSRKPDVTIVTAGPEHSEALAEFFRIVWDPAATRQSVETGLAEAAASNLVVPGERPPTSIFLSDGKILGYVSSIPVRFWNGSTEQPAYWIKGLMVLPEHRNGPIGYLLLKEALTHHSHTAALAVALPARRLFQAMKFEDLGSLSNFLLVQRPARVLTRINLSALELDKKLPSSLVRILTALQRFGLAAVAGSIFGIGLRLFGSVMGRGKAGLTVEASRDLPDEAALDRLWQSCRHELLAGTVRDGRYLRWRYGRTHGLYTFVTVREGDDLVAISIVREPSPSGDPRLAGIRVACLSEIFYQPSRALVGLTALAAAERVARALDADALLCSASHTALIGILRRRGFIRIPGNLNFLERNPTQERSRCAPLSDWWLTRGDCNADEVF